MNKFVQKFITILVIFKSMKTQEEKGNHDYNQAKSFAESFVLESKNLDPNDSDNQNDVVEAEVIPNLSKHGKSFSDFLLKKVAHDIDFSETQQKVIEKGLVKAFKELGRSEIIIKSNKFMGKNPFVKEILGIFFQEDILLPIFEKFGKKGD